METIGKPYPKPQTLANKLKQPQTSNQHREHTANLVEGGT